MKNVFWGSLVLFCLLLSCRSDEDSIQKIDQIINLYMRNGSGQDLFNKKTEGFFAYTANDVLGVTDNAPISIPLKADADSILYMEYIASAKRELIDSLSSGNDQTYRSKIALALRRTVNNVNDTINDTLEIHYHLSPSVFEVSKVFYNNNLKFTKQPNSPNIVTIIK
ncbi:hypothetical protein D1631_04370 [Chryseobacterium nematophagum]|uniref:Lipoprotein n=1 Tax=Chryseobacterium nematophagum TaxID=2305228 RepID=A0A3M7TE05_9FLAO|nr:hypothetical protein [Chryseobacterium nematophagum]RNA61226.1 hypothetical protein D1631_04370 [Chryseobacterium nematophagum]